MFVKMKVRFWFRKQQGQTKTKIGILYGTITINKIRSKPFSTGISVKIENWSPKEQKVIGKHGLILNDELASVQTNLLSIKQELQAAKKEVNSESVRAEWLKQQSGPDSILTLLSDFEVHQRKYGKGKKGKPLTEGTFTIYKTNRAYLEDYIRNNKNVTLNPESINGTWFLRLEQYLRTRTTHKVLKQSTINVAIAHFKQVLKFALSNEVIKQAPGIFFHVSTADPTAPTPLTAQEIYLLETAELTDAQRRAVDCFLFLRYTGLHYIDGRNISDQSVLIDESGLEYLHVIRQKTEEPAFIPYHPRARAIANKYGGLDCLPFTEFVNMNNRLKGAARRAGILRNITPGTGRDTFADDCSNNMGMSDESLAGMLGHTTTAYVKKYRRISIKRIIAEWKE
jgi:site-specific recombinase XerD